MPGKFLLDFVFNSLGVDLKKHFYAYHKQAASPWSLQ